MEKQHDVVIVGGGLVGSSLAIALEASGLDVALLEATPAGELPPVFDERNLSFAETTCQALAGLGIWPHLRSASPIRRIHTTRQGDFGRVLMRADEYGREAFGHVVTASDFGQALEARIETIGNLTRYRLARFVGTTFAENGWRQVAMTLDGEPRHLQTRLLVGADGMQSAVREALGIDVQQHDYQQVLFVCRVRTSRPPDGTAWERLGAHGPTALLPRLDRHYGLVHGVAADKADEVAALDEAAWLDRLQTAFGWRAGRFLAAGKRSRYPMRRVVAERQIAARAVLLGNAAQSIHPLGAQGFNLGLRDALTLVEEISRHGLDAPQMLEHYLTRRRQDRERTLSFSDGLAKISANPSLGASLLRSIGMTVLANVPGLRGQVAAGGMGYRGDLPELCRGVLQ
ncbi:2-octaprenyl-6-methoxyphenyl hydroxylase [Lysobacteraceae bacterium NML120232]|nr:2-octaprenyl-6-methoxyphenyl hydroxylase [Xanthomonadaceae bacterium NML08-0793]PJK12118.1 2-octaprenyl-6-methoxyphenyl hydroxylase [Xanthomonadaceae bacterium NML120232]